MSRCDLHMHSTASDGTDRPEALPRLVKDAGLKGFALTDHDTVAGLARCATEAKRLRITFVPGVELSADVATLLPESEDLDASGTLHVLAYFIDPLHEDLLSVCERMQRARATRNPRIVERLAELGISIDYQEVIDLAFDSTPPTTTTEGHTIGRPHIAAVLLKHGYVKSIHEAFALYLGQGAPAYVPRERLTPTEAIETIKAAGGVSVLAHPVQLGVDDATLEHVVSKLAALGLVGIEVSHPDHDVEDIRVFRQLSRRFNLVPTGGSDYHGSSKSIRLGSQRVDMRVIDELRERCPVVRSR